MTANEKQGTDFSGIARLLGRRGGLARAKRMTPEKKSASAGHAAAIRWAREKNGKRLRLHLKQELISVAGQKTPEERLSAYFNLSRGIALLSIGAKIKGGLKIAG
ncbi:MAG: hypothetical protein Q7J59_06105 [Elusimicrobiota bacterium]|nr:hypothetical protein [Elusimicrobiota bacterium]